MTGPQWHHGSHKGSQLRVVVLMLGVLAIQLGFIGSYVGAFHKPVPHRVPVAVVAPAPAASEVVTELDQLRGHPLRAEAIATEPAAKRLIGTGAIDGALVLAEGTGHILVASAGGSALSDAVTEVFQAFGTQAHLHLAVSDVVPANPGDARGLSAFYLVVGWSVGGYLFASLLAVTLGPRPHNRRAALARLGALGGYAVLSGIGGALVVSSMGALQGHTAALWALGTLVVFAVGAFSLALDAVAGVYGIALVIALVVVLGNPSAGGAYPAPLLPSFWRVIGQWLPPGAGTTAVRTLVYFPAAGVLHQVLTLAGYGAAGVIGAIVASRPRLQLGGPVAIEAGETSFSSASLDVVKATEL